MPWYILDRMIESDRYIIRNINCSELVATCNAVTTKTAAITN